MEAKNLFFLLMEYCNIKTQNTSEYAISKCIISHIGDTGFLSMEQLSKEAHISQASIHRFIRKAGFSTYEEFKYVLSQVPKDILMHRKLYNLGLFHQNKEEVTEKLYDHVLWNLKKTMDSLDISKLWRISRQLRTAKNVVFLGDDHALSIFYTLQLDLVINHIPAMLYKSTELQAYHAETLERSSVVLFFNVSPHFVRRTDSDILSTARRKNAAMILFCQDSSETDPDFLALFHTVYNYGEKDSLNMGYFSLSYLCAVLSEFINME